MREVVSLILAGGKSERMGIDKSKLDFKGKSLVQRIIAEHQKIINDVYVVGKTSVEIDNIFCIADEIQDIGPIAGLYTGMNSIDAEWYLISPCDMPFLKSVHLERIMIKGIETQAQAVVAKSDKGLEPLVAIYHNSVLPLIEDNVKGEKYAIRAIFSEIRTTYVDFDRKIFENDPFFNINYPEDYKRALSIKQNTK